MDGAPKPLAGAPASEWGVADSVRFASELKRHGVDVVDCSSGGILGQPLFRVGDDGRTPLGTAASGRRLPGFQVPYAEEIKRGAGIRTMAVGVITEAAQATAIVGGGRADLVAVGREFMYDPFWALHASQRLGVDPDFRLWGRSYTWAVDRRQQIRRDNDPPKSKL